MKPSLGAVRAETDKLQISLMAKPGRQQAIMI
jgi:hypothetical protein